MAIRSPRGQSISVGRVLAVVSQKGGVGKTTTAINVAVALAHRGIKTMLVDVDPQGSARYALGLLSPEYRLGMSDFVMGSSPLHEVIRPTMMPWLRVALAGTISEAGSHDDYQQQFATSPRVAELLVRAQERGYVVIVDTPPGLGTIVHRVLSHSQHVLVPLQCEPSAVQTTAQILRGIRSVVAENPQLTFDGILLTMYERENPACQRVAQYVRSHLPANMVFDVVIPRTTASTEAFAAGQPVVLREPADAAAQAYVNLATLLAQRFE